MAGKNAALFKPFLFADQDLDTLVDTMAAKGGALGEALEHLRAGRAAEAEVALASALLSMPTEITPWHRLALAVAQRRRGKDDAARRTLRALADSTKESRIRLWTWTALRGLGVEPDQAAGRRVDGVVVEVDSGSGVETLAAYADGTARYLLPNGRPFIWDAPDGRLAAAIADVMTAATELAPALAGGRLPAEPAAHMARMTVLRASGPRATDETLDAAAASGTPAAKLFSAATALLTQVLALAGW